MNPASGAMAGVLGSSRTMSSALDFKERANQNAANDRRLRNPNTPAERFVMPGQQQMQAQQQAQQRRIAPPQMNTFANMQKQGVARPAPPPVPANFVPSTGQGQRRSSATPGMQASRDLLREVRGAVSPGAVGGMQVDQEKLNQLRARAQEAMGQQQGYAGQTGDQAELERRTFEFNRQLQQNLANQDNTIFSGNLGQQQTAAVTTGPNVPAGLMRSPAATGQMPAPMNPLSPEEQALEDDYRARQAQEMARIEQQRLQFEQGQQTAAVNTNAPMGIGDASFTSAGLDLVNSLGPVVQPQQPQQTVRDRILTALGRPPVDAPAAQPAPVQTSVQPQEGMARLPMGNQPVLQRDAGTQRVAPAQPVIQRDTGQPATPAAPAAPTLADRVRGRMGGKPTTPSAPATPAGPTAPAAPQAQQQAPVQQPQQPAQPQQQTGQEAQQAGQEAQPQQPQGQPDLQARLLEQLTGLTENASAYSTQDIQQMREAQRADIEAQFGAQRQQLEEELARRGISASSIAAGQLGDLAGQQARAIATAEAGLTEKAAESLQRGRETAIQGLAQAAGIQLESKGLDLQSKKVQADIDAEAKRLMQQDRSLDLQSARDQAQNRIAIGQLREQAASRISRERLTMAQMQQDASQFADRLGLDRDRLESDITTRQRQLEQADERLSSEESRFIATQQAEAEQLAERQRQFDAKMGFDTSQANFQNMLSAIQMAAFLSGTLEPSDLSAEQLNQITSAAGGSPRFTGGGRGPDDRGFE